MLAFVLSLLLSQGPEKPSASIPKPIKSWIFLRDKGFSDPASEALAIHGLEGSTDPRTVERRRLRRTAPGIFDARDLPVSPQYLAAVQTTGAQVHVQSRWINAISVTATPAQLAQVARLSFVDHVEPVRGGRRHPMPTPTQLDHDSTTRSFYGWADTQLNQITIPALHAMGYTGQGVIVGILDTGFRRDHVAFNYPGHGVQVIAEHDFVNNDSNAGPEAGDDPDQHTHGTLILGCLAGYRPDEYVGGAYNAQFILCKTEDVTGETPIEEDNYVAGLEFIEAHGGDMATSSLGYIDWYSQSDLDGQTAVTTISVNVATENGLYCCTAAGNESNDEDPHTSHLIAPADAPRIITCGAVTNIGETAGFSSDGPTADGRLKPEVMACGVYTLSLWPYDTTSYCYASGTSLSTPLVACAVACLIQARPQWTVDQMRTMLFTSASDQVASGHPDPLFIRGYGIVNAAAALALDCNGNGVLDTIDLSSGTSQDTDHNGVLNDCEPDGCPADFDGSGFVDTDDFDAFVRDFEDGLDSADVDGTGFVDTEDFDAFVRAFEAGC